MSVERENMNIRTKDGKEIKVEKACIEVRGLEEPRRPLTGMCQERGSVQVIRNKGDNTYCGPAALSLLTGHHVSLCCHYVRKVRFNARPVKAISNGTMVRTLEHMGKKVAPVTFTGSPTLVGLVRRLRARRPAQRFLIRTTGHFLVLQGRRVYDNLNPTGVFFGKYNHRRYRVLAAWEVSA